MQHLKLPESCSIPGFFSAESIDYRNGKSVLVIVELLRMSRRVR
jgi:hypothetical protein